MPIIWVGVLLGTGISHRTIRWGQPHHQSRLQGLMLSFRPMHQ